MNDFPLDITIQGDLHTHSRVNKHSYLYTAQQIGEILTHFADEAFDEICKVLPEEDAKMDGKWTTNLGIINTVLTRMVGKYTPKN